MTEDEDNDLYALTEAVYYQDLSKVVELVENSRLIYGPNYFGATPLHLCSHHLDTTIIDVLLSKGARLTDCDPLGDTLLHRAINRGNETLAEQLIERGADLEATNHLGYTPLHIAVWRALPQIVNKLLSYGASVNKLDKEGNTLLHFSVNVSSPLPIFDSLLEKTHNINTQNCRGDTPLHLAVSGGNVLLTFKLIDKGADVNSINYKRQTPLHMCYNDATITGKLLSKGAKVNLQNFEGDTPLHLATASVAEKLINNGASPSILNNKGDTPLHTAVRKDLSFPEYDFYRIEKKENRQLLSHLLIAELDIDAKNKEGNTALHIAAYSSNYCWLEVLIGRGAAVDVRNDNNETCSDVMTKYTRQKNILLKHYIKLKVAGLVSEKTDIEHKEWEAACNAELKRINATIVYGDYSLGVLFLKRNNPYYLSNRELKRALWLFVRPRLEVNFPLYADILRNCFEKTSKRHKLLTSCLQSLDFHRDSEIWLVSLPGVIKQILLNYLDNETLYHLTKSLSYCTSQKL